MRQKTQKNPEWVHFGGGNLYRCFHGQVAQDLLNAGELETGIILVETFGEDMIDELYHGFDNRSLTVVMKSDGTFEKNWSHPLLRAYSHTPAALKIWRDWSTFFKIRV